MDTQAVLAFSSPQLAVICVVLGGAVIWGFQRLIASIDGRFIEIDKKFADLNTHLNQYPTRNETRVQIRAVERRVDDLALFVHTRTSHQLSPSTVPLSYRSTHEDDSAEDIKDFGDSHVL